jgi:hypothetical protein
MKIFNLTINIQVKAKAKKINWHQKTLIHNFDN